MRPIDWTRFRRAYLQARRKYLNYGGILGVGYGPRVAGGKVTDELAIVVLVRKKKPASELSREELLPSNIDGFPVDVRQPVVGKALKESAFGRQDLLMVDPVKLHKLHVEGEGGSPPPAPDPPPPSVQTAQVGQVFVIGDPDGTLLATGTGIDVIDWTVAYQYFRAGWGDDYDFVAFYLDLASGMPNPGRAYSSPVYNDVAGINHPYGDYFDVRSSFGTSRLLSFQAFRPADDTRQLRLQETAHQWAAYVYFKNYQAESMSHPDLLDIGDGAYRHWQGWFDDDLSPMDYDLWDWQPQGGDAYKKVNIGPDEFAYCSLELYLMGMRAPADVPGFYYFPTLTMDLTDFTIWHGMPVNLTVQNIQWAHGSRNPGAADSPRCFRQAFVVLTKDLASGQALAATVDTSRLAHAEAFREATESRSVLDTYLYTDPYDNVFIRDDQNDNGTEGAIPTNWWDSPDIWVRNIDDDDPTPQTTLRGQDNYVRVRVNNGGSEPIGPVTVSVYRTNWAGTEFLYPEDWQVPDRIDAPKVIDAISPQSSAVAKFTWSAAMIPPDTWTHPCLLAEVLPIHRIKTKLRHVWEDRRLAQRNIEIQNLSMPPMPGSPFPAPRPVRFQVGSRSLPARWVQIRIRQTAGTPLEEIALDLGQERWADRVETMRLPVAGFSARGVAALRIGATKTVVRLRLLSAASLAVALGGGGALEARVHAPAGTAIDLEDSTFDVLSGVAQGGSVIERDGGAQLLVHDPFVGGSIAIPLFEAERRELGMFVVIPRKWNSDEIRLEITQRDDRDQVLGGMDVVLLRG
jgi:hypothetical protein